MKNSLPETSGALVKTRPDNARSLQFIAASVLVAAVMAVSWFGAPPVPALVGAFGTGGVLLWRARR